MIFPNLNIEPFALLALITIPIIWWVSRLIPPKPKTIIFPAKRFLIGLESEKSFTQLAPLWLKIMRAAALAFLIIGIAAPKLEFEKLSKEPLPQKIVFIIEDSYSIAPNYEQTKWLLKTL